MIEFGGGVPAYSVTRQSSPTFTRSPRGDQVTLEGTSGLLIVVHSITNWTSYTGPIGFQPRYPCVRQATQVENYEGYQQWALGIQCTPALRVLTLTSPSRLVVDIAAARTSPSPRPSTVASPTAAPSPTSVAAANTEIRSTVSGAHPLLLPTAIPSNWSATVMNLSAAFFSVVYVSPDGEQTVEFAITVPNPAPPGPNTTQSQPNFHGDVHSVFQVDDNNQRAGYRWLMWNEPGTWTEPNGLPGVPYFLITNGLTDAQFWAIAHSVK